MKKLKRQLMTVIATCILINTNGAWGGDDAKKIIKRGESLMRGKSIQALMSMKIIRPSFTRQLELRTWTKNKQKALVEILNPPKETGVSSLRVSNQMWNYLPKTDRTVRVPMSMMLQSWMGSDFNNDDLVKASSLVRDYNHYIVKYMGKGKKRRALIYCKPKPNAPVVWGKILHWARMDNSLPVKQEYYDEDGRLVRTIWFTRLRKMDDRVIPTQITVKVAGTRGELTTVRYKKILYDRKIDESIFNRYQLKKTVQMGKNLSKGWSKKPLYRLAKKSFKKPKARRRKLVASRLR